jgi:hypothetical protein
MSSAVEGLGFVDRLRPERQQRGTPDCRRSLSTRSTRPGGEVLGARSSSSAGVWSAWTEMPACPPEQERRSRPGLVFLGRTRRPSRKRIALRGCRAVRPPIVRSRGSLSRGRQLSDGVSLQVAGPLKEMIDAPDLESFRDADWVPLRRGTGRRGTQRVGEWFSGLRGSSRRTSVGRWRSSRGRPRPRRRPSAP